MELFGTAGIRGSVTSRVTPELAVRVGAAVGRHAREQGDTAFVVGRDGRTTGEGLTAAMTAGLLAAGATVERVGQVPTPTLAYASQGRRGVMLTASHNPPTDNGIKLFVDGEEYGQQAETAVERAVERDESPVSWDEWGTSDRGSVLDDYRTAVAEYARRVAGWTGDAPTERPASGLRVAVDTGNGMGGVATPAVLDRLGASVRTLNGNVDGHFPGRESKPTAESLTDLRGFVAESDAAVGIAHDGDADRIVVLDADGEPVHEDTVVAILAGAYTSAAVSDSGGTSDSSGTADSGGMSDSGSTTDSAAEADGRPTVVTTPNASGRIDERVEAAGGRVERVALGYLHDGVRSVEAAGGRVAFAAEPWKHVHPAFGRWIDGVASAAVLACLIARDGLATLRAPITERPYRKESVACPDDRKSDAMDRVATRLPAAFSTAEVETEYGVRLSFDDGSWVLVRPSGTEPYLRVYAESDDVDRLIREASGVVETAIDGG